MKTEQEIIDEVCKPYGGFVNVINKCGGTLVSQLWIKSMQQYAQLSEAREAPTDETIKHMLSRIDEYVRGVNDADYALPVHLEHLERNMVKICRDVLSTQKPEEGKETEIPKVCPKCNTEWENDMTQLGCWVCGHELSAGNETEGADMTQA